ncbi:S9 family peptidase [Pollutibacter soli]|uniref:S9 family peptidase n=1 Tax=Pollutibacter soli TaxID=3034157 RepID=UPI003013C29C
MIRLLLVIFLISVVSAYAYTQESIRGISVTDLTLIKTAGNIDIAKNGTIAVFTVQNIEPDADKWEYKYVTQIWATDPAGNNPRQLTSAKEGASQPSLSPDGKRLAFVRTINAKPQIFILNMNGGEAIQLTKIKYGASNPQWTTNGEQIIFSSTATLTDILSDSLLNPSKETPKWDYEKPGFNPNSNFRTGQVAADPDGTIDAIRNYLAINEKDNKAKVIDRVKFQEESTTSSGINFNQVFIIPASGGNPKTVCNGFRSFTNPVFVNDTLMFFNTVPNPQLHPDRQEEMALFSINPKTGVEKKLFGKDSFAYRIMGVSPSGKWLAYAIDGTKEIRIPVVKVVSIDGKSNKAIDINTDRNISGIKWNADENFIYYTLQTNGAVQLSRFNVNTGKSEKLTDDISGITSFDINGNSILFAKTSVANPSEIFIADALVKNSKQITSLNSNWLKNRKLSFPEKHSFVNEKGMSVEYWVMKPIDFKPGNKYPLLLEIHGGPTAMWGPGESSMWHEYQYFCSKGFGVVYSNPRGSSGYGEQFLRGNLSDWGAGPASDVLTALDKTVAENWADTSKLFVTGGSYAGYLVTWILGHDKRFKAACSQRGVYELGTFFGEGNASRLVPGYFGGYPWQKDVKVLLDRESPLTYVNNITTPLIIFHGENDLRTGVIQSEMLYKSLKTLARPVEYVRHPGATHEITRSGNNRQRIDQMLRTYEFFLRYL